MISLGRIFQGVLLVRGQTREFPWFGNFVRLHVQASRKLEKVLLHSRFEIAFTFLFPSKLAARDQQAIKTRRFSWLTVTHPPCFGPGILSCEYHLKTYSSLTKECKNSDFWTNFPHIVGGFKSPMCHFLSRLKLAMAC